MTDYVWKHLPYAIYLDTNVLRSAGTNLDTPWINELLSITNEYGISVCISELVLTEWCEHILGVLESNRQKLLSSIALLKHYGISVPIIKTNEISLPEKAHFIETVSIMMKDMGFSVVPNWNAPLSWLLDEAIAKKPPFEHGGKGLCDVVILESYAEHTKENFSNGRVLVISNDSAVKRSEVRFKEREIGVDFVSETEIVIKLKSLLNDEISVYLEHKKSRLHKYILTHETMILDFVRETPIEITEWMLNPPWAEPQNRILGDIESILSVRPIRITDVIGSAPAYGEPTPENRYPVKISVEIEIDIAVSEYSFGLGIFRQTKAIVQPNMLDTASPVKLEKTFDWKPRQVNKTINRSLTVFATLDAEKEREGALNDFRIERII
ncbi:MAG: DUF4935 domain-containing protein [Deltaproteobacteria bacterium]|nr:DUF4935 domain-containing protein [Deltaproteobacteria bacterium]